LSKNWAEHYFFNLAGHWNLNRTIENIGCFSGAVSFVENGTNTLLYREKGILKTTENNEIEGYREFLYYFVNDEIHVFFRDSVNKGKLYNRLVFETVAHDYAQYTHICGDDAYHCEYNFFNDDNFRIRTTINGPKKNTILDACYGRAK
jgi:hypothetical protein